MPDLTKPPSQAWQNVGVALNVGLAAHLAHKGAYAAAEAALMHAVGVPEPGVDMERHELNRIANRATELFRRDPLNPLRDEL